MRSMGLGQDVACDVSPTARIARADRDLSDMGEIC
jgi:hypothetical protein